MWDEAVQRTGWTEAANSSLVLVLPAFLPEQHGCAYGQATLGDGLGAPGYAWVQGTSPDVLAHEIGHNMSLEHSNLLTCRTKTQDVAITRGWWPTGCTEWEYGDGQDIMSADLFDDSTTPITSTPKSPSASCGETRREASGRPRVRFTCGSMLRSAKSLITQPAERITTVPAMNTSSSFTDGSGANDPARSAPGSMRAANHSAHSVGQSSRKMPMGRSSRMSCE